MVPNAPFLPKIIPENQYFSLRHAVACPTMTSPDGLIGIAQRLPGFIGFEAEMRLLQCEARRKRVCNQADLCKFAGCRRRPLAAKHRCLAFRIREPQAVVERTGGSDELASPINVARISLLHGFCGHDLRRLERRRTNQAARRPVAAAGAESGAE